ncbi:phosphofructokinase [Cryobacterium zongtaii]|uniref:Phosphofructokinase n=1 Tax=Cryobacterium zongtaii TaxID=1259217 RepID=A0A2S3Z6A0_9MICO|nr:1-phosphofructokinase family hexose kinase [Cryobacterium zongtaii]POH60050.1 phosphofructokinase [Cryobacterium zongtaii]
MDVPSLPQTPPILTFTINPALDVSTSTAHVTGEHKLRCSATRIDPGGGGINVARVIRRLGGTALSLYAAGGPTGDAFRQLIAAEGLPTVLMPIHQSTRQSFTVDETDSGKQFRFVLQGPEVTEAEWTACLDTLAATMPAGGYIVASGSLPPGVPDDFYARVARLARGTGTRCIVDASGPALSAALAEGVFLVKPSLRELEAHSGVKLDTPESQAGAAAQLVASGAAEYVALTLGGAGAILASASGVIRSDVPRVTVISTVGAGDSFLGAFVLRLAQGRSAEEAFRSGVAAGSATASTPATELCHRADVERLETELAAALSVLRR